MLVSRGSWTWTALTWKHLQHSTLEEVWCWDELQQTQPRQGCQSMLCFDLFSAESTLYMRNKQWGQSRGETTSPENAEGDSSCLTHDLTLTARTWSPVTTDRETSVFTRMSASQAILNPKPKSPVHNTLQVPTRAKLSYLAVKGQERAVLSERTSLNRKARGDDNKHSTIKHMDT